MWPPATAPSSASVSSMGPAGLSGSSARSVTLRLSRYSSSFQARIISTCDMGFSFLCDMSMHFHLVCGAILCRSYTIEDEPSTVVSRRPVVGMACHPSASLAGGDQLTCHLLYMDE